MQSDNCWWTSRSHSYFMCFIQENSINKVDARSKTEFLKMVKTKGNEFKNFYWQDGYGALSVNPIQIDVVRNYIENQVEHHKTKTFQDEFRAFLKKYKIEYNEEYVWD